jgi:RecA-family ATPase
MVLYLSLEDRERQTRSRLRQLLAPEDPQHSESVNLLGGLRLGYDIPTPLMAGGAAMLDRELAENPVGVVIIDSLLAIVQQANRKGQDILQTDYNIVRTIREVAEKHAIPVVLVAHTRKAAGDVVDTVQGTSGTTAAADAVWGLARGTDGSVTLEVTGRDIEHNVFALERKGAAWLITGEGDAIAQGEERREILALLRDEGAKSPSALARALRKSVGAVQRLLGKLCESGHVVRTSHGKYEVVQ